MSRINEGLYSSSAHDWKTPADFLAKVLRIIGVKQFDLDPCCTYTNVPAHFHYTSFDHDGLKEIWDVWGGLAPSHVFVNPPYGNVLPKWVRKMFWEGMLSSIVPTVHVWGLIPARTCTKYWHSDIFSNAVVFFIQGRIKFEYGTEEARMEAIVKRYNKLVKAWVKKQKIEDWPDGSTIEIPESINRQAEKDIDNGTAPFPTALVYWGPEPEKYAKLLANQKEIKGTVMVRGGR